MTNYEFRDRVAKYNCYENHPLKSKYLEEKEAVLKSVGKEKKINRISIIRLVMFILVIVYFFAFWAVANGDIFVGATIFGLGVANLVGIYITSKIKNTMIKSNPEYKEFIKKYEDLGLVEFTTADVQKDGCIDAGCCCVTGRQLSPEERDICVKAHCSKCKTFMRAAYAYTEDEFQNMEMLHD